MPSSVIGTPHGEAARALGFPIWQSLLHTVSTRNILRLRERTTCDSADAPGSLLAHRSEHRNCGENMIEEGQARRLLIDPRCRRTRSFMQPRHGQLDWTGSNANNG